LKHHRPIPLLTFSAVSLPAPNQVKGNLRRWYGGMQFCRQIEESGAFTLVGKETEIWRRGGICMQGERLTAFPQQRACTDPCRLSEHASNTTPKTQGRTR